MTKRRYQVFVSSTYEDMQEERQEVMQALLELDCFPAGMELFPAADEDQWTLIKEIIDDCDYYIVIIGGRYGSIGPKGISYTEMEYRYALETGKPVLAFLHKEPSQLPVSKVDTDSDLQAKLRDFRSLAQLKMCRYWVTAPELGGLVSRSLVRLIKHSPGTGWVKADQLLSGDPAREILNLRKRLEEAEKEKKEVVKDASTVGLVQVLERQGNFGTESDWLSLLGSAIERIDMMGRTLYGWTGSSETAELIARKICEEHVNFRLLIMSQTNRFLPVLEENRVNIAADLKDKLDFVQKFFSGIRANLPEECQDFLRVRCFETVPLYFSYVRVDDRFYITHYMCSANSSSSPMFCLNDVSASWSKAYAREFETVWRLSNECEY